MELCADLSDCLVRRHAFNRRLHQRATLYACKRRLGSRSSRVATSLIVAILSAFISSRNASRTADANHQLAERQAELDSRLAVLNANLA
jgi:hypothetical protein